MGIKVDQSSLAKLLESMEAEISKINRKIDTALTYAGEAGVSVAKQQGNYEDQTANLRSSIGYLVHTKGQKDKVAGFEQFPPKPTKRGNKHAKRIGMKVGRNTVIEIARGLSADHALVMVAGMPYAEAVERRGYDVLTRGALEAEMIFKQLIK